MVLGSIKITHLMFSCVGISEGASDTKGDIEHLPRLEACFQHYKICRVAVPSLVIYGLKDTSLIC